MAAGTAALERSADRDCTTSQRCFRRSGVLIFVAPADV
jgi:hypothetical protein